MSKPNEVLLSKIESAAVRVGIIGLGYVGLPLARAFAESGSPSSASTSIR